MVRCGNDACACRHSILRRTVLSSTFIVYLPLKIFPVEHVYCLFALILLENSLLFLLGLFERKGTDTEGTNEITKTKTRDKVKVHDMDMAGKNKDKRHAKDRAGVSESSQFFVLG
jgi:hypothetical protein